MTRPRLMPIPAGRSPDWLAVRGAHLTIDPVCRVCGGNVMLNVHHIKPFHLFPELEKVESNLITVCEGAHGLNCHFVVGHCLDWSAYSPDVVRRAAVWGRMLRARLGVPWPND